MDNQEWNIAYCGLNCAKCDLLAQRKCAGCKGAADRQWSGGCTFRPCAKEKGHEYCFECATFPCDDIKAFESDPYAHHKLTVQNLRRMREIGLQAWIAQQPKVMYCAGWVK